MTQSRRATDASTLAARVPVEQLWQITAYVRDLSSHYPEKRRRLSLDQKAEPQGSVMVRARNEARYGLTWLLLARQLRRGAIAVVARAAIRRARFINCLCSWRRRVRLRSTLLVLAGLVWSVWRKRSMAAAPRPRTIAYWNAALWTGCGHDRDRADRDDRRQLSSPTARCSPRASGRDAGARHRPPMVVADRVSRCRDGPLDRDRQRTASAAGAHARVSLGSADVIHSFWVPNVSGKIDMMPGRRNMLDLTPRQEGWFRGQCSEYCGTQHAHMALDVKVDRPAAFDAWLSAQARPAAFRQADPIAARGGRSSPASCALPATSFAVPRCGTRRPRPDASGLASLDRGRHAADDARRVTGLDRAAAGAQTRHDRCRPFRSLPPMRMRLRHYLVTLR
jgi:hypothetical protein